MPEPNGRSFAGGALISSRRTPAQNIYMPRRNEAQLIADLEAKIASIRARAAREKVKKDPALRHISAAVRSIDKATAESSDNATRQALAEARSALSACLSLSGVVMAQGTQRRRIAGRSIVDEAALLSYVQNNSGQRGEQIAEAMGTSTASVRPVMQRLIADRKVKSRGQRRGMTYAAV